jgi:hypothetical protein
VLKATNVHSKCVILLVFHCNNGFNERASMLRDKSIASPVVSKSENAEQLTDCPYYTLTHRALSSVYQLQLFVRQPPYLHTLTYRKLPILRMAVFVLRPRHVHTFTCENRSVSQKASYVRMPRHVHTFTCENRSVSQKASYVRMPRHVHTFTYKTFSLTKCVIHHTATKCIHFRPKEASSTNCKY